MGWNLIFTAEAARQIAALQADPSLAARLKAVNAALGKMQVDLRRAGLQTHEFKGKPCPHGGKLFEAYAQNDTPGAYRIFWCYAPAPAKSTILIVAITPHP